MWFFNKKLTVKEQAEKDIADYSNIEQPTELETKIYLASVELVTKCNNTDRLAANTKRLEEENKIMEKELGAEYAHIFNVA